MLSKGISVNNTSSIGTFMSYYDLCLLFMRCVASNCFVQSFVYLTLLYCFRVSVSRIAVQEIPLIRLGISNDNQNS